METGLRALAEEMRPLQSPAELDLLQLQLLHLLILFGRLRMSLSSKLLGQNVKPASDSNFANLLVKWSKSSGGPGDSSLSKFPLAAFAPSVLSGVVARQSRLRPATVALRSIPIMLSSTSTNCPAWHRHCTKLRAHAGGWHCCPCW